VCLGAQARAANKAAKRNYEYQLQKRERDWMQTLSVTNTERVMYEQGIQASNLGLSQVYGDIQAKFGDQIGQALQEDETNWKQFLEQSKSADLAASGRTGRSIDRISTADLGARAEQMNMFAKNAIIKSPDLAPPKPVYQNVGAAAFMDALSIAGSVAGIYSGFKTP